MSLIKALQFSAHGVPTDVIKYQDTPKPQINKENDVLVRITAASFNPSDSSYIIGRYGLKPSSFPSSAGSEGVGIIEAVGTAVSDLKVGQRVHVCTNKFGTWGQYVVVNTITDVVVPVPDNISDGLAAQFTINPITALAMVEELGVKDGSGDFIVQTAAASTLGRILIRLGKAKGFKTINIVRRDEQIAELLSLGADYVINSETTDVTAKINEITGGKGVKYGLDCLSGGKVSTQLINSISPDGKVLLYGGLGAAEPLPVPIGSVIFKGITVKGYWLVRWLPANVHRLKPFFDEVIRLITDKKIDLTFATFDGATEFAKAAVHSNTPNKSEKTVLLFNNKL